MMKAAGIEPVRPAAVAGVFYASDARTLSTDVERLLGNVPAGIPERSPKALIVPHAGYMYSGSIAAHAYARLSAPAAAAIRRVVLIGPAHHAFVRGFALPDVEGAHRAPNPTSASSKRSRNHAA